MKKPTALVIDEFQKVIQLGGQSTEAQIRAAVQRNTDVGFIFAGSKTTLLNDMTLNPARPFHRMGIRNFLGPLPRDEFGQFISKGFDKAGYRVDAAAVRGILDDSEDVPYNVQALASVSSRMGVYRVEGQSGSQVQLRDLVTDRRCLGLCESGYAGSVEELWFARVLPPGLPGSSEHVVFTSPYVLIAPDARGWMQYFDRMAAKDPRRPRIEALERHLKWGTSRRYWTEFVFEGYVNHRPGAIFLEGLPDVPESRPHSKEYVRYA